MPHRCVKSVNILSQEYSGVEMLKYILPHLGFVCFVSSFVCEDDLYKDCKRRVAGGGCEVRLTPCIVSLCDHHVSMLSISLYQQFYVIILYQQFYVITLYQQLYVITLYQQFYMNTLYQINSFI